jgi:hypothetical protein
MPFDTTASTLALSGMEGPEVPLEHLHEDMHHHATHGEAPRWVMGVALSSALIAGFAAVSALLAGHHANEAMLEQIQAANRWSYYQAKSIKKNVVESKIETLVALGKEVDPTEQKRIGQYDKQLEEIKKEAEEKEHASHASLHKHEIYARGVTMFQVAIAVAAIAVLTKLRWFWYVGLGFSLVGLVFSVQAYLAS